MKNDLREEKRAENQVWAAAEDYQIRPAFLGFSPEGRADLYLNMTVGLMYKWFDSQALLSFLDSLGGRDRRLYEGLFWLGVEQAVFQKEVPVRPVLKELRLEYARNNLRRQPFGARAGLLDRLRRGYFLSVSGNGGELTAWERSLLNALAFSPETSTEEFLSGMRSILREFFSYCPKSPEKKKGAFLLTKLLPVFYSFGKVQGGFVRVEHSRQKEAAGNARAFSSGHSWALFRLARRDRAASDASYISACFGQSLCSDWENAKAEASLCTGPHSQSHIFFAGGQPAKIAGLSGKERKEVCSFRRESLLQQQKNRSHFQKNQVLYQNLLLRLREKLKHALELSAPALSQGTRTGSLDASRIYRGIYLHDGRVFSKMLPENPGGFSVDLMLDASSSRKNHQEWIAAQGYLLAECLSQCQIPVQVYSYCSIRGYTVLQVYKTYSQSGQNREIFRYAAAGSNRDGLALRGASWLMQKSPSVRKVLIVLTDASPNDERGISGGPFYKNKEYTDSAAVEDTAREVRALRKQGVQVLGVFMGIEKDAQAARKIFGRDFVAVRDIRRFADSVGNLLVRQISQDP